MQQETTYQNTQLFGDSIISIGMLYALSIWSYLLETAALEVDIAKKKNGKKFLKQITHL